MSDIIMAGVTFPVVSDVNLRKLHRSTSNTEDTISWCRDHGLLAIQMVCPKCSVPLKVNIAAKRTEGIRLVCHKCNKEYSIREGSFFAGSHLTLVQIIDMMYYYSYKYATYKTLQREIRIEAEAICKWMKYIRDIYSEHIIRNSTRIGGAGRTVEVDESSLARRKHKLERQWAFGGIDTTTREVFLVPVHHRDADTLLVVLQDYVRPGTTIVSELWKTYDIANNDEYRNMTVSHSLKFEDPVADVVPNRVGSVWTRAKKQNIRESGTNRTLQSSFFVEFMWRHLYGTDPFENLLRHIRDIYVV